MSVMKTRFIVLVTYTVSICCESCMQHISTLYVKVKDIY